ncbi:hypothetical protein Scep_007650 [Stephania cephalantha]|uniref:Uncharacterized protein n=1 Tax=Stephania cephalantha TaxID=152367 RepID=A0AAP0KC34_9MAGN
MILCCKQPCTLEFREEENLGCLYKKSPLSPLFFQNPSASTSLPAGGRRPLPLP